MRRTKPLLKSMISSLPGPVAVATWDVIWTLKSPPFREQRRKQRTMFRRLGSPGRLLGGPFAGMQYIRRATGSAFLPKIVGTYERELLPALEQLFANPPDLIIDIGAAEGYYAVGLALRLPQVRVIAYDVYPPARFLLRKLARLNHVQDRIDLRSLCSPAGLQADLASAQRPLVICDCEGFEDELLLPELTTRLSRARLLVEVHEYFRPGVGARVQQRFAATHHVHEYRTIGRTPSLLPAGLDLNAQEAAEVMNEYRAGTMEWLFMLPREATPEAVSPRSNGGSPTPARPSRPA